MNDLIDRQAAIEALDEIEAEVADGYGYQYAKWREYFVEMPSAQPERKTGHWIKTARWGRVYYCDQCRNYLDFDGVNAGRGSTNFCPNCGALMDEEKESNHE